MRNNNIAILLASAAMICSCSLDYKPLNGPSSETFPASEGEALAGTYAAYKGMSLMSAQNCYYPYSLQDCASDIFSYRPGASNIQKQLNSSLTSEHALVTKEYPYIYKVVGRVHQVLDKIDNLKEACGESVADMYRAELLCIRAHQYDQCMQFYGVIPFIDHCLTLEDNAYGRYYAPDSLASTVSAFVDRLLFQDLTDEHLDALPVKWADSYGTTRIGRVTAYTLKARIALNWGYVDVAKEAAHKAMKLAEGVYGLETLDTRGYIPHDKGEIDVTNLFGFKGHKSSKEWMWAIQRSKVVGELQQTIYYMAPRTLGGCSWLGPNQSLVDTYQCLDGLSILESPLYDYKNPYLNRDPRLAMTACLPGTRAMGVEYEMAYDIAKVVDYNNNNALVDNADSYAGVNKYEYGANGTKGPGGFYVRKFYDMEHVSRGSITDKTDELNTGLIRYAELLLIEAEACIESGSDLDRAKDDINMLRKRAGMPDITVSDQAGLRKALRYERKVELAGEGFRWFDIRRWSDDGLCYDKGVLRKGVISVAAKAVNGPQWCMGYSSKKSTTNVYGADNYISRAKPIIDDNWTVTYDKSSVWPGETFNLREFDVAMVYSDAKDRFWPFPYDEITTNPAMDRVRDQNPGYVTGN